MSDDADVADARALAHPLRVGIVLTMAEHCDEISPRQLAEKLERPLPAVAYHVRYLHKLGAIELARIATVRGANQSFYALAAKGFDLLARVTSAGERTDVAALGRALMHPLRLDLLRELAGADAPLSPRQLSRRLDESLVAVSYHVRYLNKLGYIELARIEHVRGALAHFYALTPVMREFMPLARGIAVA